LEIHGGDTLDLKFNASYWRAGRSSPPG